MEIDEVAEILGMCPLLKAPQHIFITEETVHGPVDGEVYYRGLQPKGGPPRSDTIFLSFHADETSPIHEAIHANFGLGEPGTELLTRAIIAKNRFVRQFPLVKQLVQKHVTYQKIESSSDFPVAHSQKYQERVDHYIKLK